MEKLERTPYFLMERIQRAAKALTKARFRDEGIDLTVEQWVILMRIEANPGLSQTEISDSTFKEPAAITRTLDLMQKKGLVERKPIPEDRRKYELHLTQKGRVVYDKTAPVVEDLRAYGIKGLNKKELDTLVSLLNKMYRNFE